MQKKENSLCPGHPLEVTDRPKIVPTIGGIHSTLSSAFELSKNLRHAVYIVSGKQIDTNCDFAELSKDNIPDDLLAIQHNVVLLTESLRKTLETLEESL